jgi:hypothetical protein
MSFKDIKSRTSFLFQLLIFIITLNTFTLLYIPSSFIIDLISFIKYGDYKYNYFLKNGLSLIYENKPLFNILYINELIVNKALYYYFDFYKIIYRFTNIIRRYKLKLLLLLSIKEAIKNVFNSY